MSNTPLKDAIRPIAKQAGKELGKRKLNEMIEEGRKQFADAKPYSTRPEWRKSKAGFHEEVESE